MYVLFFLAPFIKHHDKSTLTSRCTFFFAMYVSIESRLYKLRHKIFLTILALLHKRRHFLDGSGQGWFGGADAVDKFKLELLANRRRHHFDVVTIL